MTFMYTCIYMEAQDYTGEHGMCYKLMDEYIAYSKHEIPYFLEYFPPLNCSAPALSLTLNEIDPALE